MKHIYRFVALLSVIFIMASCQRDSTPFSGVDNRILSFDLKVGSTTYTGQVTSDSTVVISVPRETDLNGAMPTYLLSERSRIIPKPELVKDWNSDQVFKVIADNGSHRTYIIRIQKVKPESESSVVLATDDDVRAFVEQGVSAIHGNLIIGKEAGTDSISNIDALTALTTVDYSVIVNPTYKGKDLSGLRNLMSVGRLVVKDVKTLKEVTLKSLETAYDKVEIIGDSIETVTLPKLSSVSGLLSIDAKNTFLDLPSLETVGDLVLSGANVSTIKMKRLQTINGSFTLSKMPKLELLDMPKVMSVGKNISINNALCYSGLNMPLAKSVGGQITIKETSMTSLSLNSVESIGGLEITSNHKLSRITAPKIAHINGDVLLSGLPIKTLNQLSLGEVQGEVKLTTLASLTDLKPVLGSIKSVSKITLGNILVSELDLSEVSCQSYELQALSNLDHLNLPASLESLEIKGANGLDIEKFCHITGLKTIKDLSISDISVAKSLSTLTISSVPEVTGTLTLSIANVETIILSDLAKVKTLKLADKGWQASYKTFSLPQLKEAGELSITSKTIETIDAPLLHTVGTLKVVSSNRWNKNNFMTNLNGFKALTSITQLEMMYLSEFNDYTFLKQMIDNGSLTEEKWGKMVQLSHMGYEPSYQDLKEGRYVH